MTTPFRGIPPRILQRLYDNSAGSFRKRRRTGRPRHGSITDPFDDRRTMVFSESSIVNWPQKIEGGSVHLIQSLNPTGQFVNVTGSVRAGISDSLVTRSYAEDSSYPYIEQQLPEQGRFSQFFMTGTDVESVGPGFDSRLSSKTIIRKVLPVKTSYTMLSTTASMVYYNSNTKTFELPNGTPGGDVVTNPGDLGLPLISNVNGTTFQDISILNLAGSDARMFGPYGNNILTGSGMLGDATFGDVSKILVSSGVLSTLISTRGPDATTLNSDLAPSPEQTIVFDEIRHPFLLEKMHVKLPIKAGSGWFNDVTQLVYLAFSSDPSYNVTSSLIDVGGPAVTFALQRYDNDDRRELILSATIIPEGDNRSFTTQMFHLEDVGIVQPTGSNAPSPGSPHTLPAGFLSFATPSAVVRQNTDYTFTGSVELLAAAAVTNGVISLQGSVGINRVDTTPFGQYKKEGFLKSLVFGIDPYGRGMDIRPSGRSYMGKEFTTPSYDDSNDPLYVDDITPSIDVFVVEDSKNSPYIILPGDKLILSISKYRPVRDQFATSSQLLHSASDLIKGQLSGSHDFAIDKGDIQLTLYGSLIRDGHEFHDTLNQDLSSLAVHEDVTRDYTLDQFDVEAPTVFKGSYVDDIITGTLGHVDGKITRTRGVAASAVDTSNSTGSLFRNIRLSSTSERFYDTLLPPAGFITSIDGGGIWNFNDKGWNFIQLGVFDGPEGVKSNTKWYRSFPFEPKYGSIIRQRNPGTDTVANTRVNTLSSNDTNVNIQRQKFSIAKTVTTTGPNSPLYLLWTQGQSVVSYIGDRIVSKAFYGFGDGIDAFGQRDGSPKSSSLRTSPPFVDNAGNWYNYAGDVEIRGWKYGVKNGSPQFSSAVYRRDRYGQFRDMLEQRLYTRYIEEKVNQGPVFVRFTLPDPADTDSSNLSQHATSSLPYFDGIVRNRGVTPDVDLVQVDIPDIQVPAQENIINNNFVVNP